VQCSATSVTLLPSVTLDIKELNMFNPSDINVGNKVIICCEDWCNPNITYAMKTILEVKELFKDQCCDFLIARVVNRNGQEFHCSVDSLIRVPVIGDVVMLFKPIDDQGLWEDGMDKFTGKPVHVKYLAIDAQCDYPWLLITECDYIFTVFNIVNECPINEIDLNRYPHKCPKCNSAAYIGFNHVECTKCGV
jgi:hypothetical protein